MPQGKKNSAKRSDLRDGLGGHSLKCPLENSYDELGALVVTSCGKAPLKRKTNYGESWAVHFNILSRPG